MRRGLMIAGMVVGTALLVGGSAALAAKGYVESHWRASPLFFPEYEIRWAWGIPPTARAGRVEDAGFTGYSAWSWPSLTWEKVRVDLYGPNAVYLPACKRPRSVDKDGPSP